MGEPGNQLDEATESEDKTVALLIAVLALFLALSEAGAKKAEHHSTEKNIEASDLYNFYQAKKARSTMVETAAKAFEAIAPTVTDEKAKEGVEKQIDAWKAAVAKFENDPKKPEDSLEKIQERAHETRRSARALEQAARTFRVRQRRAADRHRAGLGGDHHRRAGAGLGRGRARR